jgi:hypothetical protein
MKKSEGFLFLALGVVGLGLWARSDHAPRIQGAIAARAEKIMAGWVHSASAEVAGRDIHITGIIDGPNEAAALMAALDSVPGQRVIT